MNIIKKHCRKAGTNGTGIFFRLKCDYRISNNVVERTIKLCKQIKIKLPDAIIAATALIEGFTLVTRNINDFIKITELTLLSPWNSA